MYARSSHRIRLYHYGIKTFPLLNGYKIHLLRKENKKKLNNKNI